MINLDPKNQIRHIDTKDQLADILTKGNFTRDAWNNLLHLSNIRHFSSTCCAENSSLISCSQHDGEEDARTKGRRKNCGKIKAYGDQLVFNCFGKFLRPRKIRLYQKARSKLIVSGEPDARRRRNSNPDAASSSQVRLQDAFLGGFDG